jgi:predicted Zn-dependent peptidase
MWLIAEVERKTGEIYLTRRRAEKAEAELAEAEKEIHARAEGEQREWERAEKLKAENQRLQERVRGLEELQKIILDALVDAEQRTGMALPREQRLWDIQNICREALTDFQIKHQALV